MNLTKLLAKSIKNGGTTLIEHSTNTANIASYLCDFLNTKETIKTVSYTHLTLPTKLEV